MKWVQIQPTFQFDLSEDATTVIEKLLKHYENRGSNSSFVMTKEYGEIHLPKSEHRLWSPYLTFYADQKDQSSFLYCRYSPRAHIITFVWFVYVMMTCAAFFSLMLASSQLMLGQPMWGLWVAIGSLVVIASLYVIAHVGQQWSADQMIVLRQELESILNSAQIPYENNESSTG